MIHRLAVGFFLLVWTGAPHVIAQPGRSKVLEGNKLYSEKKYQEARDRYLDALKEAPDSSLIRYNEGDALYQSKEFQKSQEAYMEAIRSGDPSLVSKAWYNLGNALFRQEQLQESLEAYKQALRIDPDDLASKHNLEVVLKKLEEQQKQQQQQKNQDPDQDQDQDQNKENQDDQELDRDDGQQQEQDPQDGRPDDKPQQREGGDREQDRKKTPENDPAQADPAEAKKQPMTREEAQRLLQAIRENPKEIRRKMKKVKPQKVEKDW